MKNSARTRDYANTFRSAGTSYVMAVPKNTSYTDAETGREIQLQHVALKLNHTAWQRRACGIGTKGFRIYDWALIADADADHQYMIRRSIDDGELAFYHCYNPGQAGFGELVNVAGARWPIEECFGAAKNEVGLDEYQVRKYDAWYRHMTLAMFAHTFPGRHRTQSQKGGPPPAEQPVAHDNISVDTSEPETPHTIHRRLIALTIAEIRRLLNTVIHHENPVSHALHWSNWRREHQTQARRSHFVRRLRLQTLMI